MRHQSAARISRFAGISSPITVLGSLFILKIISALSAAEQHPCAQRLGAVVALPAGQERRFAHGKRRVAVPLFGGFGLIVEGHASIAGIASA